MSDASPLLEVVDLDFAYRHGKGWLRVLHGVSFAIQRGEAFGLVGESGCGKSTVAYQLLGRFKEAYYDYKKTLELEPNFTQASERLKDFVVTRAPAKVPG